MKLISKAKLMINSLKDRIMVSTVYDEISQRLSSYKPSGDISYQDKYALPKC